MIEAARKLGGKVVLGGHSLGGAVVTGYATWDFNGRAGADQLAGLVYDDGGELSCAPPLGGDRRRRFGGFDEPGRQPVASVRPRHSARATRASSAPPAASRRSSTPTSRCRLGASVLLPPPLKPPVPVTNLAQFGWGTSVATSQLVFAIKAHDGAGLDSTPMPDGLYGWDSAGSLTPIKRFARMLSGYPLLGVDGTEWYFPQRLTDDSSAIDNGNANPAQ